ncbi:MAG TPA: GatB/YqeY domain-containing protein [Terracidiphilus sp.]|nr:GatB/YqeY domain-containing protein [Terracidiphilus sp.]
MIDPGALAAQVTKLSIESLKAHDADRTTTLRLIKTALMNKAVEKNTTLTPAEEQATLATMIKQRRDSIEQFTKGGRPELAAKEAAEITVIEEFLPKALDEAALKALVAEAVAAHAAATGNAPGPKDMGPVIKAVQAKIQQTGARAEGKLVSDAVKAALAG